MPSSCTQWDPYRVLNIDKSSTVCYGWAPSQGRNCRNPISRASRQEATSVLSSLTTIDPSSSDLGPQLQTLARLLLCKRNHQNQAGSVLARWKKEMDDYLRSYMEEEAEEMRRVEAEVSRLRRRQRRPTGRSVIAEVSPPDAPRTAVPRDAIDRLEVEVARIERAYEQLEARSVELTQSGASRTAVPSLHETPHVRIPPRPLAARERQSGTSVSTPSSTPEVQLSASRETSNSPDDSNTVDTLFDNLGTSRLQCRQWLEQRGLPESATPQTPLSVSREMFDSLDESGFADMFFELLGTSRSQIRRELEERERVEHARRPLIRPGSGFQTWAEYVNWMPRPPPRTNNPTARQPFRPWREASNRHAPNSIAPNVEAGDSARRNPSPATLVGNSPIPPPATIAMLHPTIALSPAMLTPKTRPLVQQPKPPQDCSICYEELQDGNSLVSCKVQCKQRFHEECIKTWFQSSEKRTCPYW